MGFRAAAERAFRIADVTGQRNTMDTEELPDFLSEDHIVTPEAPPAAPEAPSQEPAAAPAAPVTDPAAAPAAPPQEGDPTPAPAAVETPAPAAVRESPVPLATFLDVRERMQRAERALADRQAQEAAAPPDRNVDPDGYEQHQQATMQLVMFEQRRDMSRTVAEVKFGEDVVNAAFDWAADACDRSPGFNQAVMAAPNPAGFVVAEYQRQQRDRALSDVSVDDIAAFRQWKANQATGAQPGAAPQPAAAQAAPVAPRRSLASAPSAGASAAPEGQDGEQVFDEMFGR